MSRWLRLIVLAVAALCLAGSIDAPPTYAYDVPTVARFGVHEVQVGEVSTAPLSDARQGAAPGLTWGRGTPTTPSRSFVATEAEAVSASTPTGQRGSPMDVPRGTNGPAEIGGPFVRWSCAR